LEDIFSHCIEMEDNISKSHSGRHALRQRQQDQSAAI